jgi:hypothetical protein
MKSLGDAPYIDLFSDEYRDDAGGVLDRVRSETGLVQTAAGPMVIRHDLVHALVSTRRLHSSLLHWGPAPRSDQWPDRRQLAPLPPGTQR